MKTIEIVEKKQKKTFSRYLNLVLVINSQFINNFYWKCQPPLFELLLIIQHKSVDHAFRVRYWEIRTPEETGVYFLRCPISYDASHYGRPSREAVRLSS